MGNTHKVIPYRPTTTKSRAFKDIAQTFSNRMPMFESLVHMQEHPSLIIGGTEASTHNNTIVMPRSHSRSLMQLTQKVSKQTHEGS